MIKEKVQAMRNSLPDGRLAVASAVAGLTSCAAALPAFASETGSNISAADWSPVIESLTSQISFTNIVAALATFVAAGIGIVFGWWGLRKGIRSLMAAFRKGKMSV